MSRAVTIATVQPPAPVEGSTPDAVQARALALLAAAAGSGADVVCLPEYLNCMACGPEDAAARAGAPARELLDAAAACARRHGCYVVVPVVIDAAGGRFNRAHLLGRQGQLVGHFDKVHLTQVEREDWGVTPGDAWPVFDCDFGRVGVLICYDGCFVEPARILALQGAEVLFWPSLQRAHTEAELSLQTRAHAYFNHAVVVRSSYGTERHQPWQPGQMVGMSCVCGPDGTILSSLGRWVGWTSATIDLDVPQRGLRSFGGEVGLLREMRLADRRPDTYRRLTEHD